MVKLEITKGDSKVYELEFLDESGNKLDLTNKKVWFTVKRDTTDTDADALIQKVVTSHTDAINGITQIVLTPQDTNIPEGMYLFDIQLTDLSNNVWTPLSGYFVVKPDITKST